MAHKDTKQKILDAAEDLFALDGYHATSLRAITQEAGVNLAAVNYHFGSKEELVGGVIRRRMVPLNEKRLLLLHGFLQEAARKGERVRVRDILLSFVEPTMQTRDETALSASFVTLIGRALAEPDDAVRRIFMGHMQPVFQQFFQALQQALPDIPDKVLFWRLHCTIGATSHLMRCVGKCPMGRNDEHKPGDAAELVEMLIPFVTAGMEAPL